MSSEMTWREAIDKVLGSSTVPMHYKEIADRIVADGLIKKPGVNPAKSVSGSISISFKSGKEPSPYVRISSGVFALRAGILAPPAQLVRDVQNELEEAEEQYEIITAFGMFWRRESIEWTGNPKLLGMAGRGATPVDFCKQRGIYLLYDGREVIYVGRSTDRPLGKRLYEHTIDRLSTRWDRFSWFGLLPISDDGQLGVLPDSYKAENMIPALEAILIEALEPRQNRRRGDDLAAVEYLQKVDPEIEKKRIKATLDAALNKL